MSIDLCHVTITRRAGNNVFCHTPNLVLAAAGCCQSCTHTVSASGFNMAAPNYMGKHDFKQQYTSNMEVGSCGVFVMSRDYPKTLFGPIFQSWWNCPLRVEVTSQVDFNIWPCRTVDETFQR